MPVNDYLVPLLTCTLTAAIVCLDTMLICCCLLNIIIVIIIEFWAFSWSLLCYTLVSVLVLGIGIARGQYYWVLEIGCLSWYHSNPNNYQLPLSKTVHYKGDFVPFCLKKIRSSNKFCFIVLIDLFLFMVIVLSMIVSALYHFNCLVAFIKSYLTSAIQPQYKSL